MGLTASLALFIAQGVLANGFTACRHGPDFRYVTHRSSFGSQRVLSVATARDASSTLLGMLVPDRRHRSSMA